MAASTIPSAEGPLRSSRRVQTSQPPAKRRVSKEDRRDLVEQSSLMRVARPLRDHEVDMPPKKKARVVAPASRLSRQDSQAKRPGHGNTVNGQLNDIAPQGLVAALSGEPEIKTDPPPTPVPAPEEKRQLRSHGGASRIKSDLALFIPGYDELISNEPKPEELWSTDMKLFMVDEDTHQPTIRPGPSKSRSAASTSTSNILSFFKPVLGYHNNLSFAPASRTSPFVTSDTTPYPKLHNSQRLDFSSVEKGALQAHSDPLTDESYSKAHRKAERREKQLRNIEKNRAQHEKDHLDRLLEGLRGPDWLRVMGISGITESEKREYERKRDFLIGEVTALLEKFKAWKEEDKRRKIEKDHQAAVYGEDVPKSMEEDSQMELDVDNDLADLSDGDPPDYSDVDAWAARQLHQEALSATGGRLPSWRAIMSPSRPARRAEVAAKPFTSFYSKPYLRAAAIGKHRRSGRSTTAFGRPLPDVSETEFTLPSDILTEDAKIASARNRRRKNRGSKDLKAPTQD